MCQDRHTGPTLRRRAIVWTTTPVPSTTPAAIPASNGPPDPAGNRDGRVTTQTVAPANTHGATGKAQARAP